MQFCSFLFFLSWPFKDAFHSFIHQSICSFNCLYILLFFYLPIIICLISSRFTLLSSGGCFLLFFLSFILINFLTVAVNVSYNLILTVTVTLTFPATVTVIFLHTVNVTVSLTVTVSLGHCADVWSYFSHWLSLHLFSLHSFCEHSVTRFGCFCYIQFPWYCHFNSHCNFHRQCLSQ